MPPAGLELTIEAAAVRDPRDAEGSIGGEAVAALRARSRAELDLPADRPIVATGHQTLLWHPGILVKYMLVDEVTAEGGPAAAHLIVDQHADGFGSFDVPVRPSGGALAVETVELVRPRPGVPMVRHPAFLPPAVRPAAAIPSVRDGVTRILEAIGRHRDEPDAALQMAAALADLMSPWVRRMPGVRASDLPATALGLQVLSRMGDDPTGCAGAYNAAVAATPEAGIGPLRVAGDDTEVPLWRLGPGDRRERATVADVRRRLDGAGVVLLPRALMLTALVRLAMCDLFVHGTGGATYDRAMERWIGDWLGLRPCPIAVASATLRLPLVEGARGTLAGAVQAARRARHDPEAGTNGPGPAKRDLLAVIEAAPPRSHERRRAFYAMHDRLEVLRHEHAGAIAAADRAVAEAPIAERRTWPFPLYPDEMLNALAEAVRKEAGPLKKPGA